MVAYDGLPARYPELAANNPNFGPRENKSYVEGPMRYKDVAFESGKHKVLILGNSFARDFINMANAAEIWPEVSISYSEVRESEICNPLPKTALDSARQADKIFWSTNLKPGQISCITARIIELESVAVHQVLVIGTKGFGYSNDSVMRISLPARYQYRAYPSEDVELAERQAKRAFGSRYISLLDKIRAKDGSIPIFTPQKQFISQDTIHLTRAGSVYIGKIYFTNPQFVQWPQKSDK